MLKSNKSRLTLWSLCLVIGAEIFIVWLTINYLISKSDYQPLIQTSDLPHIEPSIPFPTDHLVESNVDRTNYVLRGKIFNLGTSDREILQALGEPVWRKPGFWKNSIAWSYKNVASPKIDIGYIFDSTTNKLRQAEIAVPSTTNFNTVQLALESLLGASINPSIVEGLQAVYQRQQDTYSFKVDNKKGIIQRNNQDRIYIGVWEADFH